MSTVNPANRKSLLCPRCQRANPANAVYCYHDGIPLQASGRPVSTAEIVFPSNTRVHNPEELLQACLNEWSEAGNLLQRGELSGFLQRLGRLDLVRAVDEAKTQTDPDLALYQFLDALPGSRSGGPRLDLEPRRIQLTSMAAGSQLAVSVTVTNRGSGQLQGKVVISEGQDWLRFSSTRLVINTTKSQQISVQIDSRSLIAGQIYSGKLTVVSNGGIAELPVRLELKAVPFSQAPYQGVSTPRELAQRMLANPKPAVGLLENGQVAAWFRGNGWTFPVTGAAARGIGSVQQFFECLGLSKPPPIQISEDLVRITVARQPIEREVTLRTASRKWVYAQIESDVPWLQVKIPSVSGPQEVKISFAIEPRELPGPGSQIGNLRVLANGNQKLAVKVEAKAMKTVAAGEWSILRPMLAGALLFLLWRLLLIIPADGLARWRGGGGEPFMATLGYWQTLPVPQADYLRWLVLTTCWSGAVLGLVLVSKAGGRLGDSICGFLAGSAAGLAGWSILGCLMLIMDGGPRWLIGNLGRFLGEGFNPIASTIIWLLMAALCWALLGMLAGLLLGLAGSRGLRLLAEVCRFCLLGKLADWIQKR